MDRIKKGTVVFGTRGGPNGGLFSLSNNREGATNKKKKRGGKGEASGGSYRRRNGMGPGTKQKN